VKKIINLNQLSSEEWERAYTSYVNLNPKEEEKLFALKEIVFFLEKNYSNYFISVGTCLGIYRDNKLIEWDDDIDIDLIGSSYERIIKKLIDYAIKNKYPFKQGNNMFHPKINIFINKVKVSIGKLSIGKLFKKTLFRPKTKIPLKEFQIIQINI
jgi:phosphorylcholine metabolism protein LicD